MAKIEIIYKNELAHIKDAIKNSRNPYHTFTLSTINGEQPESRTVVLRGLDVDPLKIYFNADYRSPKVKELKDNDRCTALFYDQGRRIQLRFICKAVVNYQNSIVKKVWENTALQSRKCYMGPFPPSTSLDKWDPNIPSEYLKTDPNKEHSEEGYLNFTHIELKIIEADFLELHHDGHIRFKIDKENSFYYVSP